VLAVESAVVSVSAPELESVLGLVLESGEEPVLAAEWAAVSVSAQEPVPVLELGEEPELAEEPVLAPGWGRWA
jgi:hypothetical protein